MKQFKITREIQKSNNQGQFVTTEKGVLKTFSTEAEAKQYMIDLRNGAAQKGKFSKVTSGAKQFRAYTQGVVYIYRLS